MKKISIILFVFLLPYNLLWGLNQYYGVNFMSYQTKDDYKSANSINAAYSLSTGGLNSSLDVVTWFQNSLTASNIYPLTNGYWQTPTDDSLNQLLAYQKSF